MGKIFDIEGPVVSFFNRLADLVWLNILFLVCSLPIFTIGASSTALFYVTLKMVRNEEAYVTRSFFKSFKTNFKQSTVIWLIALFLGIVLVTDFGIINGMIAQSVELSDNVRSVMNGLLIVVAGLYVFTTLFVFPLTAKFENTTKNMIRNAFFMSCRHFPTTIVEICSIVVFSVLVYFVPGCFVLVILIMFSLIAYISSFMYVKVFDNYIPKEENEGTDDTDLLTESDDSSNDNVNA